MDTLANSDFRILLAEDNLINQKVTKLILQKAGFPIEVVADGKAAIEAHQRNPYALILMDFHMPILDGIRATIQIRQQPLPQPIIIGLTACAMEGDRRRFLDSGMDGYLSKPFSADQLVQVVRENFER